MRFRDHRFPTDKEVRVAHGKEVQRARLANISATGARLRQLSPLTPGGLVILCQLDLKIPAKVVWSNERQTGVTFLKPLKPADLQTMAGTVGQAAPPAGGWRHHGFREIS
ncbi:PilZ domain-containing protein [Limimaricola sp.]|uniref:PilZ domain-containing protein n=1 Tax=Limimaricola sp. TaxID=2211665 RepID=UPI004058DD3C